MMKAITEAWRVLEKWDWNKDPVHVKAGKNHGYGDALMEALNKIIHCPGITIEICGAWVWVGGDTRPVKDVLKEAGYFWASKKKMWYFRPPEWASANRYGEWTIEAIREKFDSEEVKTQQRPSLAA